MLQLKFLTPDELAAKKAEIESRQNSRKRYDAKNISDADIEELLKGIRRPFDHKNKKPFHFITVERSGIVFLFDGLNKFVELFERKENESELDFRRNIRLFALDTFLKSEKQSRQNGGFLFNDSSLDMTTTSVQNNQQSVARVYDLLSLEKDSICEICDNIATSKIYVGGIMTKVCNDCLNK